MSNSLDLLKLISEKGAASRSVEDIVDNQAAKILNAQVDYANRSKKINIRNKLSPEEADAFRARYGGAFDLNLTQQYNAPHSLAGALRIAEHYDCLENFPSDDPIIDFGGSWWHHYSRRDNRVHCCTPILGVRDACRQEERLCRLRRLLQDSEYDELPNFCMNKAEECKVQADWAICIHGGYDMGFKGLCKAMNSHGVRILRGTIMFDGAMLFDREGRLPLLKCRWKREGSGKSEVVKFDFENESTLSYVHSWANLGSFLTESVCTIGATTYMIERELIKCNIMTYKIVATNLRCPVEKLRHCIWFENISQYVAVNIPDGWSLTKWKNARVARSTVREVEEIAFRCFKENKDWTENMRSVASILSAKSSTVIINGQAIMAGERLDLEDYHLVAFALTMNLYQKYERIRAIHDGMQWKGWVDHFKTRIWWNGDVGGSKVGVIRSFLSSHFPFLRLDSYEDSKCFLEKIVDVKEFESDSVPSSLLSRFFSGNEDFEKRVDDTVKSARSKREEKKKLKELVLESSEVYEDAVDAPSESVRDDDKPETGREVRGTDCDLSSSDCNVKSFAIKEFADYNQRLSDNAVSNLRRIWTLAGCNKESVNSTSILETYHRIDDMLNIHYPDGRWLYPNKYEYMVGFNDSGLGYRFADELYLVDKTCGIANCEEIAKACKALKAPNCSITLCDGVAGCGKTTAIKAAFDSSTDLIVTANRKSAEDVREALFGDVNSKIANEVVRTADSAIMHGLPKCSRLLIDEAGLLHYGQLLAVAALCGCETVLAFGDTEQISFKSRDVTFKFRHAVIEYDRRDVVTETFRCPEDVISAIKKLKRKCGNRDSKYLSWRTQSSVKTSLGMRSVSSVTQVNIEKHKFYLTMTQADKAALVSRAKDFPVDKTWVDKHIKTVHEAQGVSVDHVVLVRLKSVKCDLFKTEEYCLVGLTRHKRTFEYLYNGDLGGDLIAHCLRT
ncbi:1a protein [Spring beauty latent virus]|uniref:Replication protein 1a n=1 Tax=Spring beauty latent virus TaxID=188141 RepID=Q8JW08_9BROM|nr:1a protein [Spring beauty latent virus]BAC10645.1 1a protein [Spring beauty latent virus]